MLLYYTIASLQIPSSNLTNTQNTAILYDALFVTGSSLSKVSLADIDFSDLEFKEMVGSGGFGTVSKGRWISENKIVAIKTMVVLDEREVSYKRIYMCICVM